MRTLRGFVLQLLLALVCSSALAEDDLRARLVGTWREYSPTDNLVRFDQDGSWKLYLRKGEIGNLRALEGRWSVSEQDATLTVVIVLAGKEKPAPPARLSFEGDEMVLTAGGKQTRHRRHEGPIPQDYRW